MIGRKDRMIDFCKIGIGISLSISDLMRCMTDFFEPKIDGFSEKSPNFVVTQQL